MVRITVASLGFVALLGLAGCPMPPAGNGNLQENQNGGGGGSNTNGMPEGNGNANTPENSNANINGNVNANVTNSNSSSTGDFRLRSLSVAEDEQILSLQGDFGTTPGEVFVNGSARALAGGGWTANQIEVAINPLDLGEVYVEAGGRVTNSRWITGWDFTIRRTLALRSPSVCASCQAKMTWRFRMRNDVQPVEFAPGNVSSGGAANRGVRGATFSLDSVNGSFQVSGESHVLSAESVSPAYYSGPSSGSFVSGDGEWFSAFASVDPSQSRAIVVLHIDTEGYRDTNLDTGDSDLFRITDFGVFTNLNHPGTIVMPVSPSLNIPAGSTPPDSVGSFWEWEAAPVQSPPPTGA